MDKNAKDKIAIGCVVGLYCSTVDEHIEYRLVKSRDIVSYKPKLGNRMSFGSKLYYENITQFAEYADDELAEDRPLAQALMGKRLGESFKINEYVYRIERIVFPDGQTVEEKDTSADVPKSANETPKHAGVDSVNGLAAECTEEELQVIHGFEEFMLREFPQFSCESRTDKIVFFVPQTEDGDEQSYQFWFVKRGGILTFRFKLDQNENDELKYFNNVLVADSVQFEAICVLVRLILSQGENSQRNAPENAVNSDISGTQRDNELFEELRICRYKKAQSEGIAAYCIMGNRTLTEVVRVKPTTYAEWIGVKGLGDATYKKIGAEFIEIINRYVDGTREEVPPAEAEKEYSTVNVGGLDLVCDGDGKIITDTDLLEELRQLRLTLAQEEGVSAFCIFTNAALIGLATYKPQTKEEWLSIKGLGEAKFAKYSPAVFDVINSHRNK